MGRVASFFFPIILVYLILNESYQHWNLPQQIIFWIVVGASVLVTLITIIVGLMVLVSWANEE